MEGALSIIKDPERREKICSVVPKLKLAPLRQKTTITGNMNYHNYFLIFSLKVVRGPPMDESPQFYGDYVYARSISTYPRYDGKRGK